MLLRISTLKFQAVSAAYQLLADGDRRSRYDATGEVHEEDDNNRGKGDGDGNDNGRGRGAPPPASAAAGAGGPQRRRRPSILGGFLPVGVRGDGRGRGEAR